MLARHEDAVQLAVHLRTLETAGHVVVGTYDEVLALQAMNSRVEADPASPTGFALTLRRLATGEAAEAAGITRYDVALPQRWVDHMTAVAGDPRGHFVWSYEASPVCGEPFPTTTHGAHLLSLFCTAMAAS
jgi:hypothetical protein